ncbi:M20/M25/M40 family metallo-hydrolase [Rhizobium ruizarguesonis]|uniref:M20/M25/M40 family metallo-hydrolase n=1 Tax=Rhizobium ruizarguesonis TaxID=2081791 RepID=UPI0010315445|nr:M20/M25/M40 family metallo-hydrolase [Rhizobium ruizarguesonis]TBA11991.1 M20/M25/M40 family metallo-hydrolase [Rhizobium ruizarguesonis]
MIFTKNHVNFLEQLLSINTVSPLETGVTADIPHAMDEFAKQARSIGFEVAFYGPAEIANEVPIKVKQLHSELGEAFLTSQPSMVLTLGTLERDQPSIMFNFHMDTVGPHLPVYVASDKVFGRGAADNKGPGVALLAAVEHWLGGRGSKQDAPTVLIQCVSGEEGGAMGIYGTLPLVQKGYYGSLNVFMIPSNEGYFDCSTASMTVEIAVDGQGSTDDFPEDGDNATLLLSSLTAEMSVALSVMCVRENIKLTIAGLNTGSMHNRVYGTGTVLLNFSYRSVEAARHLEDAFDDIFHAALNHIKTRYGQDHFFARTAKNCESVTKYSWLKKGLPVLSNRSALWESKLALADINRHVSEEDTFTCDAMWGNIPGAYSIMFGPGDLLSNGAHTANEHIGIGEIDAYCQKLVSLLKATDPPGFQNIRDAL